MTRQIGFARLLAGSRIVFVIAACVGGLLVPAASADTINFDNVANGTVINSAYAGLTFSNPLGGDIYARSTSLAASPGNVVSILQTGIPAFHAGWGAVDVAFSSAQQNVSIDAAPGAPFEFLTPLTKLPFLQAFDAGGNLLAADYYSGALPDDSAEVGPYETLSISRTTADIAKIRFSVQNPLSGVSTYGLFDNLSYSVGTGGGGGDPTPVVPLPAAVWAGLALCSAVGATRYWRGSPAA